MSELWDRQGIGRKRKGNGAGRHEKASRTASQTRSVFLTHTLLVQTHNMTTKLQNNVVNYN